MILSSECNCNSSHTWFFLLCFMSLLSIAIDSHLLEAVRLTMAGNLLASSHSSVESLQFRKLVKTAWSEDEMTIK